jgi:transcriptional regulator with XRE-family HTH domain
MSMQKKRDKSSAFANRLKRLFFLRGIPERGRGALLMKLCNVKNSTASNWLSGKHMITDEHAGKIAKRYACDFGWLYAGIGSEPAASPADPDPVTASGLSDFDTLNALVIALARSVNEKMPGIAADVLENLEADGMSVDPLTQTALRNMPKKPLGRIGRPSAVPAVQRSDHKRRT